MIVALFGFNFNPQRFSEPEFSLLRFAECVIKRGGNYELTPQGKFIMSS